MGVFMYQMCFKTRCGSIGICIKSFSEKKDTCTYGSTYSYTFLICHVVLLVAWCGMKQFKVDSNIIEFMWINMYFFCIWNHMNVTLLLFSRNTKVILHFTPLLGNMNFSCYFYSAFMCALLIHSKTKKTWQMCCL